MKRTWKRRFLTGLALGVMLTAGCAATPQPFDYHDDREEKPGPGLFSGEAGGFVIDGRSTAGTADEVPPPAGVP